MPAFSTHNLQGPQKLEIAAGCEFLDSSEAELSPAYDGAITAADLQRIRKKSEKVKRSEVAPSSSAGVFFRDSANDGPSCEKDTFCLRIRGEPVFSLTRHNFKSEQEAGGMDTVMGIGDSTSGVSDTEDLQGSEFKADYLEDSTDAIEEHGTHVGKVGDFLDHIRDTDADVSNGFVDANDFSTASEKDTAKSIMDWMAPEVLDEAVSMSLSTLGRLSSVPAGPTSMLHLHPMATSLSFASTTTSRTSR